MPGIIFDTADIDDQIAVARENLRELIEQAAAYSGATDDDLVANAFGIGKRDRTSDRTARRSSSKHNI